MSQDNTTPTPPETLEAATERNIMPLKGIRPVLIGTYLKPEGNSAMIRANGRIRHVTEGDRIGQAEIVAIDLGKLVMSLHGEAYNLTMPGRA